MDINYHVAVIGCGRIGGKLAKELCRLLNGMRDQCIRSVVLADGAVIGEDDIRGQEFLPEDIGWTKSAVLAGILSEVFPRVPVSAYGNVLEWKRLQGQMGLTNCYSSSTRVAVIFDMSNGDRRASQCIRDFFKNHINCIVVTPAAKGILHTAVKLGGVVLSRPVASENKKYIQESDTCRIMRLCLTKMAILLSEGRLEERDLFLYRDGIGVSMSKEDRHTDDQGKQVSFLKKEETALVVCVGCGGTGGNFIKEFVHGEFMEDENISMLIVDGDRVEEKNLERQPFSGSDLRQNKARCLREDLCAENPNLVGRIFDYPFYLDSVEDLCAAVDLTGHKGKIILIGAVDNHRARQVMEHFYHEQTDIMYVDAANEWSNGEVVVSLKKQEKQISPLRSFYYPDVLTDRGLSASETSCGVLNQSAPQHLCTNLASAQCVLSVVSSALKKRKVRGGIVYFDAFREYARYQEVWNCDMAAVGHETRQRRNI